MESYYSDMKSHFKTIKTFCNSGEDLLDDLHKNISGYDLKIMINSSIKENIDNLESITDDELMNVFKFWDSLKSPNGFLSKIDLGDINDDRYYTEGEIDLENDNFKRLQKYHEQMMTLKNKIGSLKDDIDKSEFSNYTSYIFGCFDKIKIKWIFLMLNNKVDTDPTLKSIHDKFFNIPSIEDYWAYHIKTPDCEDVIPLTTNERIYFEIKELIGKCTNTESLNLYLCMLMNDESKCYENTKKYFDVVMAVYELDLMLNYYLFDIKYGYETRKGGFKLNFVMLRYYWWPYISWIYVVKIWKQTWGEMGERFVFKLKSTMLSFLEWWISLPVFLAGLPLSLAGEGFKHHTDSDYKYLNILLNFFGKHDVAKALVFAITQPLKFLMMLIGFVIALFIMIIYTLLTVCGIHFAFAAIYTFWVVIFFAILITIFYASLSFPMTIFFIVIWLIDLCTAGLMISILRCENDPNKWYTYPSYAYDNQYNRQIFCTYRCYENYEPSTFLFLDFCSKIPKIRPSYCPQQTLFKLFKNEDISSVSYYKDFEVNTQTINMSTEERLGYLTKIRLDREEFNFNCKSCFEKDVILSDDIIPLPQMWGYQHISKYLCKYTTQLIDNNKLKYEEVCDICQNMYGGDLPMYTDKGNEKNTFNTTGYAEEKAADSISKRVVFDDEISKGIIMFIVALLLLCFVTYIVYKYDVELNKSD